MGSVAWGRLAAGRPLLEQFLGAGFVLLAEVPAKELVVGVIGVCPAVLLSCRCKTCRSNWIRTVAKKGRVSVARWNPKDPRQTTRPQPKLLKPGEPVGANPWRPDFALIGGRGIQRIPGGISRGCGQHGGTESSMTRGGLIASHAGRVRSCPGE